MTGRRIVLILLLVLFFTLLLLYFDSNTRLVTERFTIASPKIPRSLSGLTIVQLSDVHLAEYGPENEILFSKVRAENPDCIVLTGDLIYGYRSFEEAERAYIERFIPKLLEIAPVYFVTGNHEFAAAWVYECLQRLKELGVTVLQNDYVLLSDGQESILLCGIDDPNGRADMQKPDEVIREVREKEGEKFLLVLYHRHNQFDLWKELGVDLVLCGHAHGGMVRLPFIGPLYAPGHVWFPKYTSGLYEAGETRMIVSRGVGGPPFRFLNNPEIVSVTLVSEKDSAPSA